MLPSTNATLGGCPYCPYEKLPLLSRTVQQPGWDRLRWEFTVSERAVCQTSATSLHSADGVFTMHHPPTLELGRGRDASSCWRRGQRGPARARGWSLAWIDSEDFMIDIELGKNISQCIDESIFLPTPRVRGQWYTSIKIYIFKTLRRLNTTWNFACSITRVSIHSLLKRRFLNNSRLLLHLRYSDTTSKVSCCVEPSWCFKNSNFDASVAVPPHSIEN